MSERRHEVRVEGLPSWLGDGPSRRLLGPTGEDDPEGQAWRLLQEGSGVAWGRCTTAAAADLAARLRGVGLDGALLACAVDPPLKRAVVRQARTEDARRRRSTSAGFARSGARTDEEGRWSLTPEALAVEMADWAQGRPVVDAGCGAGGNAIAFARAGCEVVAIEADGARLSLARHNAGIYGVAQRIRFVCGDARERAAAFGGEGALLFLDPPWGREWSRERTGIEDFPLLSALVPVAAEGFAGLWAKLPPSFDLSSLAEASGTAVAARALFGAGSGDHRRVKFILASTL